MVIFRCIALAFSLFILPTSYLQAEIVSKWRFQVHSLILEASTNLDNPSLGKSAAIALAYEKSFFRCKPSLAFIIFDGIKLGDFKGKKTAKKSKNQLTFSINNKSFVAKKTVMNTYSNGVELVASFNNSIIDELSKPSNIIVSIGGGNPLMQFQALNSIEPHIEKIYKSCDLN